MSSKKNLSRWGCTVCAYAYDPERGDPDHGVMAGTAFTNLPEEWRCPWCGATKEQFEEEL